MIVTKKHKAVVRALQVSHFVPKDGVGKSFVCAFPLADKEVKHILKAHPTGDYRFAAAVSDDGRPAFRMFLGSDYLGTIISPYGEVGGRMLLCERYIYDDGVVKYFSDVAAGDSRLAYKFNLLTKEMRINMATARYVGVLEEVSIERSDYVPPDIGSLAMLERHSQGGREYWRNYSGTRITEKKPGKKHLWCDNEVSSWRSLLRLEYGFAYEKRYPFMYMLKLRIEECSDEMKKDMLLSL